MTVSPLPPAPAEPSRIDSPFGLTGGLADQAAWSAHLARLDEALEADPTDWTSIIRMRPQDGVRRAAHDTLRRVGHHPSAMIWGSPAGDLLTGELAAFWGDIYKLPAGGEVAFLSGSSEAILTALLCARARGQAKGQSRGQATPMTVIRPTSGHPAIDKAAHYLGLSVKTVPIDSAYKCDLSALADAIDDSTIAIIGAVPSDCHGACDPIEEMAALAQAKDVWFHVDGAIGGCLVPFLRTAGLNLPACDFDVPGITSIGLGLHKYGYAPIGIGVLMFREAAEGAPRKIDMSDWDGAAMVGDQVAGLRSLGPVAGAWAVRHLLGHEGYTRRAEAIAENQALFAATIREIDGMTVLLEPQAGVVTFNATAPEHRGFAFAFAARGHRGKPIQSPGGFVVCIGPERGAEDLAHYTSEILSTLDLCKTDPNS